MRRKRNAIEVFSLSAIDLFASALGTFIIIAAILIPYYPNMKEGGKTVERLTQTIKEKERDTAEALRKMGSTEKEIAKRKREAGEARRRKAAAATIMKQVRSQRGINRAAETQLAGMQKQLGKLRAELKKRKIRIPTAPGDTEFAILGITTKAKSIVVIVDLSGSMKSWSRLAIKTLNEIIDPFHKGIKFAIVGFQGRGVTRIWPPPRNMAWADDKSKRAARAFISSLPRSFNGGTPTEAALLYGLGYRPEAIILISDGKPSGGKTTAAIIQNITRLNGGRVEISTVALGDYLNNPGYMHFLNNLAKKNKGSFVGVLR